MRSSLLTLPLIVLTACQTTPTLSLKDARLAEGPVIIQRGEHFFLLYRQALFDDVSRLVKYVVDAKKTKDAGYFYFGAVSGANWGNRLEIPLAAYDMEELARHGRIYWLDPNGTKHPIPIRHDD